MPSSERGKFVSVLGPMGSGKSTLINQAEQQLGAKVYRELPPSENSFFTPFYEALVAGVFPNPHVLDSQLTFLRHSVRQAGQIHRTRIHQPERTIVWEMPPWGHFMYAWMQHQGEQPIMSFDDWGRYCKEFKNAWKYVQDLGVMPQVVAVTLLQDVEELLRRIGERDRKEEVGIPPEYVAAQLSYWQKRINKGLVLPKKGIKELGMPKEDFEATLAVVDAQEHNWTDSVGFAQVWQHIIDQTLQTDPSV